MDLHIFNPEHEIAMAWNQPHVTAPHAVEELRMSLGWMPSLWAKDDDVVLVDDTAYAVKAASKARGVPKADVLYLEKDDLVGKTFDNIIPWGWDKALKTMLDERQIISPTMPSAEIVDETRQLSSRELNVQAIKTIRSGIESLTCGDCFCARTMQDAIETIKRIHGDTVVKSPWSSSGRGIRYIDSHRRLEAEERWLANVLSRQGCVVIEPYYNKVKDFAMEFAIDGAEVRYKGLSLFHTYNGGYAGNIIASEEEKRDILHRYIPDELLIMIRERIADYAKQQLAGIYNGPFGVDMMVVADANGQGFVVHPFVELNLRRTMGHVALDIRDAETGTTRVMRIRHNVNYYLKISDLNNNFVQVL